MVPLDGDRRSHARRELAAEDPVAEGLADVPRTAHPGRDAQRRARGATLDDLEALGVDPVALRDAATPAEDRRPPRCPVLLDLPLPPGRASSASSNSRHFTRTRPTLERFIEKTAFPATAFAQLLLHATLDVVHARELHRVTRLPAARAPPRAADRTERAADDRAPGRGVARRRRGRSRAQPVVTTLRAGREPDRSGGRGSARRPRQPVVLVLVRQPDAQTADARRLLGEGALDVHVVAVDDRRDRDVVRASWPGVVEPRPVALRPSSAPLRAAAAARS